MHGVTICHASPKQFPDEGKTNQSTTKLTLTDNGGNKKRPERHVEDRWDDVDEPVGEERGDSQKQDVAGHIISVTIHLQHSSTLLCLFNEKEQVMSEIPIVST